MKKTILILLAIVLCWQINGFSQKSKVGVTGGVSVANMSGKTNGQKLDEDTRTGFTFGMIVDAPISSHISFQPGLHYVQKGKQKNELNGTIEQKRITALRYAELQLNFLYNTNGEDGNFFIGLGPTASINLPSKTEVKQGKKRTDSDLTFGNTIENMRGFDYGADVLAGFRFSNGFFISANYTRGLRNLVPGGSGPDKLRNYYLGFRLGILVDNK